jgi:hypothetical protein
MLSWQILGIARFSLTFCRCSSSTSSWTNIILGLAGWFPTDDRTRAEKLRCQPTDFAYELLKNSKFSGCYRDPPGVGEIGRSPTTTRPPHTTRNEKKRYAVISSESICIYIPVAPKDLGPRDAREEHTRCRCDDTSIPSAPHRGPSLPFSSGVSLQGIPANRSILKALITTTTTTTTVVALRTIIIVIIIIVMLCRCGCNSCLVLLLPRIGKL